MKFDHMCLVVCDLDEAIELWTEVLGFTLGLRRHVPDGLVAGPGVLMTPELMDDVFKVKGAKSEAALLQSEGGAIIELQQCSVPKVERTPDHLLRYANSGVHELGLTVTDIDGWFERVRAAGYKTQTEYVFPVSDICRTFLFEDQDGNLIQLVERMAPSPEPVG